jgi:flavin-dependent dehydrogenase
MVVNMKYDVIIIGAGPGGIFSAYELMKKSPEIKVAVFEEGNTLEKRKCPKESKVMHQVSYMCYYEWFRWCRRIFRWKV